MDTFIVHGEVQLQGKVRVSGAKNATLPIMAATVLSSGETALYNVPHLRDVEVMRNIIAHLGAKVYWRDDILVINTTQLNKAEIPEPLMREMRASIFLMGALLGRFRKVRLSYPGGCAIGLRPINLHLAALEALGATLKESGGYIEAEATRLRGADIILDFPSVGATENIMLAAALADGVTTIRNAAHEPEIVDLQNFLNAMGAKIIGAGQDVIHIEGVAALHGAEHRIIPDRIEAGTLMCAGAITGGDIVVDDVVPVHLAAVTAKLREAGFVIVEGQNFLRVQNGRTWRGVDIKTFPHPGFPTDLQAPIMSLLAIAKGTSVVTETIFENRFKHVGELLRMGAQIKIDGRTAFIRGVPQLHGTTVTAHDLRAGAAMVVAGLAAAGTTRITQVAHIDRGYEALEKKLNTLGAKIMRV